MELFNRNAPVYDDELKEFYVEAKTLAMQGFDKVAVGEVKAEFMNMLKDKMRLKFRANKLENEKCCEHECMMFLNHNFLPIESKLRQQEYEHLYQLVDDLKEFKDYFYDKGPSGSSRDRHL